MVPPWQHSFAHRAFGANKGKDVLEVLNLTAESIAHAKAKGIIFPDIEGGLESADELKAVSFFDDLCQKWDLRYTGSKHWFPADPNKISATKPAVSVLGKLFNSIIRSKTAAQHPLTGSTRHSAHGI